MVLIKSIIAGKPLPELHGSSKQAPGRSADTVEMSQQNKLELSAPAQAEKVSTLGGGGESNEKHALRRAQKREECILGRRGCRQ